MATHGLLSADAPRLIEESSIDEASFYRQWINNSNVFFFPQNKQQKTKVEQEKNQRTYFGGKI